MVNIGRFENSESPTRYREIFLMIWTIITILFVLWLLGLVAHIGGAVIHVLLVLAVIGLIYNLVVRNRTPQV